MFKTYYQLAKPGIVYGNALAAIGGFLLASHGHVDLGLFLAMLLGVSLVMASGCVYNNYIDRGIDKLMSRTDKRVLVTGTVSARSALVYATILGLVGICLLLLTNILTALLGLIGFIAYVVLYGIGKRRTVHGTLIGSISGAIPPVIGYCAVSGRIDGAALLLFVILVFWQMPHFYAIATYRRKDYVAAGLPVLPVKLGMRVTKVQILVYIVGFVAACTLLTVLGYTGYAYLITMLLVGLYWLSLALPGFKTHDDDRWARKVFGGSLVVLLVFSFMISIDAFLP